MTTLLVYLALVCFSFFILQWSWRLDLDVKCEDIVWFTIMSFLLLGLIIGPLELFSKVIKRRCGGRIVMKRYTK